MSVGAMLFMTRPASCIFRLAADAGWSGGESGVTASALLTLRYQGSLTAKLISELHYWKCSRSNLSFCSS